VTGVKYIIPKNYYHLDDVIRLQDAERLEARVRSILQTAQTDEEYKPHAQAHSFHLLECSAELRKLAGEGR